MSANSPSLTAYLILLNTTKEECAYNFYKVKKVIEHQQKKEEEKDNVKSTAHSSQSKHVGVFALHISYHQAN